MRTAPSYDMSSYQDTLAHQLHVAAPIVRTHIIAQQATSPAPERREAIGRALAGHIHALGACTAIEHLSRDQNDDVRAAAIKTATTGVERGSSYLRILRRASLDPCARIRRLALKGLQKGGLVADPKKLNARMAPGIARGGRSLDALFPQRSRTQKPRLSQRTSDRANDVTRS